VDGCNRWCYFPSLRTDKYVPARLFSVPRGRTIEPITGYFTSPGTDNCALKTLLQPARSAPGRSQQLRCSVSGALQVQRTRTSTGQRSFAVYGPSLWNSLPATLRTEETSLAVFRRGLKTFLFSWH